MIVGYESKQEHDIILSDNAGGGEWARHDAADAAADRHRVCLLRSIRSLLILIGSN